MEQIKELLKLEATIRYHDYLYFVQDNPVISDSNYDILKAEYREKLLACPEFVEQFKANYIAKQEKLKVVPLTTPWVKTNKFDKHEAFQKLSETMFKEGFVYELCPDGPRTRLVYENGILTSAYLVVTDKEGVDISHRLDLIEKVPYKVLAFKSPKVEVSGYLFANNGDFNLYLGRTKNLTAEHNSVISSMLKSVDELDETNRIPLNFKGFSIDVVDEEYSDYINFKGAMESYGFDMFETISDTVANNLLGFMGPPLSYYPISTLIARSIVIDKDKPVYEFTSPKLLISTEIKDCIWESDLFGRFTPSLICEQVESGKSSPTIRVKLPHPSAFIKGKVKMGAVITIMKDDDGGYSAVGFISDGKYADIKPPSLCPYCNSPVVEKDQDVYQCTGTHCPGKFVTTLYRVIEDVGFDLSMTESNITDLVDMGYVDSVSDIFKLTSEDLSNIGLSKEESDNLLAEIESLKNPAENNKLSRWLYVAGIPSIGRVRAMEIVSTLSGYPDIKTAEEFVKKLMDGQYMFERFGLSVLPAVNYLQKHAGKVIEFLDHLDEIGDGLDLEPVPITLTGEWYFTFDELKEKLKAFNFYLDHQVSALTTVLLTGKKPSPSKIAQATQSNVEIIDVTNITSIETLVYNLIKE